MTPPLRVVIVEDESLSLTRLELALKSVGGVDLAGTARDGKQGLALIRELNPDVVFLDIRMPGIDGLKLAEALAADQGPLVIFVTAFSHFAVEAFELAAADYLLKPVEFDRVAVALDRARERLQRSSADQRTAELEAVLDALRGELADVTDPGGAMRSIWVTEKPGVGRRRVSLSDVDWLEAERDYVRIHAAGRTYLVRSTLRALTERLDPSAFQRVHRSAVVNLKAVEGLRRTLTGSHVARLRSGAEAPVGRAHVRELKSRLGVVTDPAD